MRAGERADGQVGVRASARADGRTHGRASARTDKRTDERTSGQVSKRFGGRMDKRAGGRAGGWADAQVDVKVRVSKWIHQLPEGNSAFRISASIKLQPFKKVFSTVLSSETICTNTSIPKYNKQITSLDTGPCEKKRLDAALSTPSKSRNSAYNAEKISVLE